MSALAGILGSGAGIVVIGVAVVVSMFLLPHSPQFLRPWVERGIVVLMFAGGSAIAVTTLGTWTTWIISHVADVLGGLDAAIPRAALILVCLFLMGGVLVSLIWAPNAATGMVAAFLPVILGLVAGGFIHDIYTTTVIPAQAFASSLNTWIGG